MAKRSVQELKEELQKITSITPWSDIKENKVYHIAPIISLSRRDIRIIKKDENEATYQRVDNDDTKEGKLHRTSVFARFMIEKKNF